MLTVVLVLVETAVMLAVAMEDLATEAVVAQAATAAQPQVAAVAMVQAEDRVTARLGVAVRALLAQEDPVLQVVRLRVQILVHSISQKDSI